MATHSITLAWKIPWAEKPGRLQSMGSQTVRYDWATSLTLFTFMHWRRKWQPTPVFLPGESQGRGGRGAWWAAVYEVTQSRTQLKQLGSSSSMSTESVMPFNHFILCCPFSCSQSFPASGSFPVSQFLATDGQSIAASVSASDFQWIFRVDFLWDWQVWSLCCPKDS